MTICGTATTPAPIGVPHGKHRPGPDVDRDRRPVAESRNPAGRDDYTRPRSRGPAPDRIDHA